MKNKIITGIILFLLTDFLCFAVWIFKNQIPVDGFYFGMITGNIIKLIY